MKKETASDLVQWKMKSKVGPLYLVASTKGLQGVFWEKRDVPNLSSLTGGEKAVKIIVRAVKQLEEYMEGKRSSFDLPLDIVGTQFQQQVWEQLMKIPYGETRSYKDIACVIKKEAAVRAVGAANGRNPLSIIVPCHRVIASSGVLQGYAGGLPVKAKLLEIEKQSVRK